MADISAHSSRLRIRAIFDYLKRSELALAIGIMAILVVLILPLPPWLLDVCLAFSLSLLDPDPDDGGVHQEAAGILARSRPCCSSPR